MIGNFSITEAIKYGFRSFGNHAAFVIGATLCLWLALIGSFLVVFIPVLLLGAFMLSIGLGSELQVVLAETDMIARKTMVADLASAHTALLVGAGLLFVVGILLLTALCSTFSAGYVKLFLELYDTGKSRLNRLFSCFSQMGTIFAYTCIVLLLIGLPIFVILFMLGGMSALWQHGFNEMPSTFLPLAIISLILFMVVFYLFLRLFFSMYVIVDKKLGAMDSIKTSWILTKGHVLKLFGLLVAGSLMNLPFSMFFPQVVSAITGQLIGVIMMFAYVYAYRHLSPSSLKIEPEIELAGH